VLALLLTGIISLPTQATEVLPGNCSTGALTTSGTEVTDAAGCQGTAVIPNSMTVIRLNAFDGFTSVTAIIFQEGSQLETIETGAFAGTGITSISIPDGVRTIGAKAFMSTASLTGISFGAGSQLTSIGVEAFVQSGITAIEIPASVTTIDSKAFELARDLATVTFAAGSSLTSIQNAVFQSSAIGSITLPSGITSIGAGAFFDNQQLTSVTIPATVTSIGNAAFGTTPSLNTVRFEGLAAPTLGTTVFANTGPSATASIKHNATGFDLVSGLWNGLLVSRDAAPSPAPVSSSPAPAPIPPVTTAPAPVSRSFSLDTAVLAKQQKKVLRALIQEVSAEGSFEVVTGVVREPGQTKKQAKALALAKARAFKNYLVLKGVEKKNISLKTKIYQVGESPDTRVLGTKPNSSLDQ
jgi:hypothetical protein